MNLQWQFVYLLKKLDNLRLFVTTQPIKSKWGNFPAKTNANASDALSPCFRQVDK